MLRAFIVKLSVLGYFRLLIHVINNCEEPRTIYIYIYIYKDILFETVYGHTERKGEIHDYIQINYVITMDSSGIQSIYL